MPKANQPEKDKRIRAMKKTLLEKYADEDEKERKAKEKLQKEQREKWLKEQKEMRKAAMAETKR